MWSTNPNLSTTTSRQNKSQNFRDISKLSMLGTYVDFHAISKLTENDNFTYHFFVRAQPWLKNHYFHITGHRFQLEKQENESKIVKFDRG